jgi:hypothetical protein
VSHRPSYKRGHGKNALRLFQPERPLVVVSTPVSPSVLKLGRFAGRLVSRGRDFGYIRIDGSKLSVFIHRDICDEQLPWNKVRVGDRLRFEVKESQEHKGLLVAGRVAREKEATNVSA